MAERAELDRELDELHAALGVRRGAALAEAMKPPLTVPMPVHLATSLPRGPSAGLATAATPAAPTAPTSVPPPAAPVAPPAASVQPPAEQLLALPAPEDVNSLITLDVSSGQAVTLDHLGPVVVNSDGTLARITNCAPPLPRALAITWRCAFALMLGAFAFDAARGAGSQMTAQEQQVTKRRIAKRNIERLKVFRDRGDLKEDLVSALQAEGERSGATNELA